MLDPLIDTQNPNETKLSIPFTQYLRPDGRQRIMRFDVVGDLAVEAKKIMDAGLRFECEILSTDEVSLTVFDEGIGENVAIEICSNGPGVPIATARLIHAAVEYVILSYLDRGDK